VHIHIYTYLFVHTQSYVYRIGVQIGRHVAHMNISFWLFLHMNIYTNEQRRRTNWAPCFFLLVSRQSGPITLGSLYLATLFKVYIYFCMLHLNTHIYICINNYTHTHIYTYIYMCVCMCAYVYACIYIYICTHICWATHRGSAYGVAAISRLFKSIGFFCRILSLL